MVDPHSGVSPRVQSPCVEQVLDHKIGNIYSEGKFAMQYEIDSTVRSGVTQYYWRLRADNNRIIAGPGDYYHNKSDCRHDIGLMQGLD